MVPVLRDADALSFAAIEQRIGEFARRAREGSITLEELTGGTFSITNGGIFGSLMSTPDRQCAAERDPRNAQDSGASDGDQGRRWWCGR